MTTNKGGVRHGSLCPPARGPLSSQDPWAFEAERFQSSINMQRWDVGGIRHIKPKNNNSFQARFDFFWGNSPNAAPPMQTPSRAQIPPSQIPCRSCKLQMLSLIVSKLSEKVFLLRLCLMWLFPPIPRLGRLPGSRSLSHLGILGLNGSDGTPIRLSCIGGRAKLSQSDIIEM